MVSPPAPQGLQGRRICSGVVVGSGSGFLTVAMAMMVGPEGLADHRCVTCGERGGVRVTKCRRLPLVLVVWLKRFARTAGIDRRIEAAVRRLGEDIDLADHLDPVPEHAGDTDAESLSLEDELDLTAPPDAAAETPVIDLTAHPGAGAEAAVEPRAPNSSRYRTRAVVCHHGETLSDGHYTCWARAAAAPDGRANDSWVRYDDSSVGPPQPTLPPSVAGDAYLVFYELAPSTPAHAAAATDEVAEETEEDRRSSDAMDIS